MTNSRDILDNALQMLRDRSWNGPAVNPVLEREFARPGAGAPRQGLRLVLGVGAALIGCGAVAAAARPAWRSVFGSSEAKAALRVVSVAPAKVEAAPTLPASRPAKTVRALQRQEAAAPAAATGGPVRMASALPATPMVASTNEKRAESLDRVTTKVAMGRPMNPYMKQMASVLWDRYHEAESHGDAKGCDAIKALMRAAGIDPEPQQVLMLVSDVVSLEITNAEGQAQVGEVQFETVWDGQTFDFSPTVLDGEEEKAGTGTIVIQGRAAGNGQPATGEAPKTFKIMVSPQKVNPPAPKPGR